MTRYLHTLRIFWSASLAAEMEYRANFIAAVLTSVMTLVSALLTLALLYRHGYEMGGWSWPQALVVVALYTLLDGIQASFLAPNRTRITEHVREGTLDFVLLKPIDTQFWLSLRTFSPWGLPNIVLGVVLLGYAGSRLDLGALAYVRGIVPVMMGALIVYSLGYILSTLTIWFVKLWNITLAMSALLEAGRYPVFAYPAAYQVFFTVVLPVAFMTTVPAQIILGETSAAWLSGLLVVTVVLFAFARWFWRVALRYYTSASS